MTTASAVAAKTPTAQIPERAQIVVIGGGIIGCSTAYHLARDHGAEVVLVEQASLTSGSTWHAAGLVGQLRASASITKVLKYSVDLYRGLEAETGLATGWKMTGCLRLATTQDRWIEYQRLATTARSFGMEMELISPAEVKRMWPLLNTSDLIGASWLPSDGQASPSDITLSLAKGARMHGARIFEGVRVIGFRLHEDRITAVETDQGPILCDKVVNCAGQWARQIGALAGVTVPLQPIKHQYIITEPIPGLARDAPTLRDPDRRTYFKEEVGGLVMGGYEANPQLWTKGDVPSDWGFRLFDDDWDHFAGHMEQAVARIPALETAGVKRMINGPESFTPDGNFILGRANSCANMYVGAGFNAFGIASGGGAGWVLADWVMTGEAPMDLWVADIRRFSDLHRDRDWVGARTAEAYGKHYSVAFPHEEMQSGRGVLTSPLYQRLRAAGAVFGQKMGWERANWFAPSGTAAEDIYAMGRQNWFEPVGAEHHHVRSAVGLFDQSSFAKFELKGVGAAEALDRICAGDMLKPVGRVSYTQLLNARGGIECDLTVARLAPEHFYLVTGTGFRSHDFGWIKDHLPKSGLWFEDVTERWGTLALMGPKSRAVLTQVSEADVSNEALPFGHMRLLKIARATCRVLRITYVGELGYELHLPLADLPKVYDALMAAGQGGEVAGTLAFGAAAAPLKGAGLRPIGYRALESLRLEKGYRAWASDITPNDTPLEAGLAWAVKLKSGRPFLGREALEQAAAQPLQKCFAGFLCADPAAVLLGRETILRGGDRVGYLTSGGYGYTLGSGIGYGYLRCAKGIDEAWLQSGSYQLVVAGEPISAQLSLRPFYDPDGLRIKA